MLFRKGVYPYGYIDGWDKFNENIIPSKESFYSNLTLENITKTDYAHANNVFKKFNINNLGEYHDLYVRSDTLLLADVFENFRQSCLKNYELDYYFKVPKGVRLNSTHFFIMKIPNKREFQQIALNHSSDIDFKDFMNIYKKSTKEPYSFFG